MRLVYYVSSTVLSRPSYSRLDTKGVVCTTRGFFKLLQTLPAQVFLDRLSFQGRIPLSVPGYLGDLSEELNSEKPRSSE